MKTSRHLNLIVYLLFSFVINPYMMCLAQEVEQTVAPTKTEVKSLKPTPDNLSEILSSALHLTNTPELLSYKELEQNEEKPEGLDNKLALYDQQLKAIQDVAQQNRLDLISNLVEYLDYPRTPHVPLYLTKPSEIHLSDIEQSWPAFKSLLSFGPKAVPNLEKFIRNKDKALGLRMTALQVVRAIEFATEEPLQKTQALAIELCKEFQELLQPEAVKIVDTIITGRLPFWGVIQFNPITLTLEEARELITLEKRIKDVNATLLKEAVRNHQIRPLPETDFVLLTQQVEAIRTLGVLRDVHSVPVLVAYMDYLNSFDDQMSYTTFSDPVAKRRVSPVLKAIFDIGDEANPILDTIVRDSNNEDRLRIYALSALHDSQPEMADAAGKLYVEELEKKKQNPTLAKLVLSGRPVLITPLGSGQEARKKFKILD